MSVGGIRDGLKTRLQTVTAFKAVYDTVPGTLQQFPCAVVLPEEGDYSQVLGGGLMVHRLRIYVVIARGQSAIAEQDALDSYLGRSGVNSIWAAIDGDGTLNGACQRAWVTGYGDYGAVGLGAETYLGARFDIEAWEE